MSEQAQTFLDRGTRFEGRILVTGVVRLDGYFKGDGRAQGTLVVGESGEVEAELEVDRFVVHGSFSGNVFAKERVEIGPTGRVHGSVTTPCLQVRDGAQLTASIHMGEAARRTRSAGEGTGQATPPTVNGTAAGPGSLAQPADSGSTDSGPAPKGESGSEKAGAAAAESSESASASRFRKRR